MGCSSNRSRRQKADAHRDHSLCYVFEREHPNADSNKAACLACLVHCCAAEMYIAPRFRPFREE
jgi:hypothetical protein